MPSYGPNMRHDLAVLIHGDTWPCLGGGVFGGYGHWIIYHWSNRNKKSAQWDNEMKEAKLGPVFETIPLLIKTRRYRSVKRYDLETEVPPGLLTDTSYIYYIEYFIPVQVEDFIYEIEPNIGILPPNRPYQVKSKLQVIWTEPIFGNEGRVEYNLVVADSANTSY